MGTCRLLSEDNVGSLLSFLGPQLGMVLHQRLGPYLILHVVEVAVVDHDLVVFNARFQYRTAKRLQEQPAVCLLWLLGARIQRAL